MRWNPESPLSDLFDNLFRDSANEKMERRSYDCTPSTNILEKNESFELHLALPGVKKEDIQIDLEKNILNIQSKKKANEQPENGIKYNRREFVYGTFCRTFTLPDTIDKEKIKADMTDGILKVVLPKKQEAKVTKEIKIS